MRNVLIFFLLPILVLSCQKERMIGDKKILVGTWDWRYTEVLHYCDGYAKFERMDSVTENATYQIKIEKKGVISFLKNEEVESSYNIKTEFANFSEQGIVKSNTKLSVMFLLDGNYENRRHLIGTPKESSFDNFPISERDDCNYYPINYFRKRN